MQKYFGAQSVRFEAPVFVTGSACIAGKNEGEGPLGKYFDKIIPDALYGEDSFEKCERKLYKQAVLMAIERSGVRKKDIRIMLGGDLLNQIVTAGYSARDIGIPFLGLYGACSTMAESMLLGSMLIDGGMTDNAVCCASSHFATAERQFRVPLEMGTPRTPTSQNTVTGAGAVVLCKNADSDIIITGGTVGRVCDLGINDAENMGAAMAPAAAETIFNHLADNGIEPQYYDRIITGDLGSFGSAILTDILLKLGCDIRPVHTDCGAKIFSGMDISHCGGSGCGCSGITLTGYYFDKLKQNKLKRILFVATGALLSPTIVMQGETIPAIAHAVVIERRSL